MGRGRISMEFIEKEKSRKTTFQKRKNGLMKKVNEFSILCDVDVCVILYAPNFEGQGYAEPETWPKDSREVQRILQKYYNTTIDLRPKIYDVQHYFKERMKKVEFEISKVRKEMIKIMYPTWDESFNSLGEEELRQFASMLDSKFSVCNQKMSMLQGDIKGKAIACDSRKVDKVINTPNYFNLNPNRYFNLMQNMSQPKIYPPLMNLSDKNPLGFWPFQLGQNSQLNLVDQVNTNVTYDPKFGMKKNGVTENDENLLPYYYNGNTSTIQSYPIDMHTLPFQNIQNLPNGFQYNGFYDMDILQAHMFDNMDGRNEEVIQYFKHSL